MATALMTSENLLPMLDLPQAPFLLDVREPDEFSEWAIPGAVNIPLGQVESRYDEIPTDRDVVVICAKGARAQSGADILSAHGRDVHVLEGGMSAWASTYDTTTTSVGEASVLQIRRRGKGCLSYVIGAGDRCVVIDPSLETTLYRDVASTHGWTIAFVLDTHLHADHISGARELVAVTGARLLLNPHDPFTFDFEPLSDGLDLPLGKGVSLVVEAVSVPGHTEGSTLYRLGELAIFTGDTLFLESVGRPDLADKADVFAHNLYRSLHERVLPLSDDVLVFPAHYGAVVPVRFGEPVTATLGSLRHTLPALAYSEEKFVEWAIARVTDRPPNYRKIVEMNAGLVPVVDDAAELEMGPNRCAIA